MGDGKTLLRKYVKKKQRLEAQEISKNDVFQREEKGIP